MEQNDSASRTVKDPVCGADVVPGTARGWDYLYQETVYHFCGPDCRSRFQANPKGILQSGPGRSPALTAPSRSGRVQSWGSAVRDQIKKWRGK